MTLTWPLLLLAVAAGPHVSGEMLLPDGRRFAVVVSAEDLEQSSPAVRVSPRLREGAFWSFGDAHQRGLLYRCTGGAPPAFADGLLACPGGATPRLSPDVTLPADPAVHPDSNVPSVGPKSEPPYQKPHFLAPWILPCLVAIVLLVLLAAWLARRAKALPFPAGEPACRGFDGAAWTGLALTSALGLGLRLYGVGAEPFEQNEFTYYISGMGHDHLLGVLLDVNGLAQTHPPLPHLLLWMLRPFGSDEVIARLPSALAGAASVPLMFLLAWRLFSGRLRPAIAVALLAAVAPVHVWYSQDVSPYALTTLSAVIVLLSMDALLAAPERRRPWWGLIIGTWGLVYTHYYGLHLSIACYLLLAVRVWKTTGPERTALGLRTLSSGFTIAAGVVPWIPAFFQGYSWSRGHSTAYQRLAGVYHAQTDHLFDAIDALRLASGLPLSWRYLALGGFGLAALWWRLPGLRPWRRALLLAPLAWFIPFELLNRGTFLAGLYGGWYFGIRYLLFLFPIGWLLLGVCVDGALGGAGADTADAAPREPPPAAPWRAWPTLIFVAALTALGATYSTALVLRADKPDVASAAHLVKRNLADGDAVIVGPAAFYQHPFHYYMAEPSTRPALRANHLMATPAWQRLEGGGSWVGVLSDIFEPYERTLQSAHIRRVWVVDHTQHLFDRREFSNRPSKAIRASLQGFELTWERNFHDCQVRLYSRRASSPPPPETLHFGWSDGPWVRRFQPPWAYASPGRRVRPGSAVRFELPKARALSGLRLRAGVQNPDAHTNSERAAPPVGALHIRVNGARVGSVRLGAEFTTTELPLASPISGSVVVRFDLDRPPPGAPRPPEVVLDWLKMVFAPAAPGATPVESGSPQR